jgi:hypothetical protein
MWFTKKRRAAFMRIRVDWKFMGGRGELSPAGGAE